MTDLDRRMRRVRIALLFFGIPFVAALVALAFRVELSQQFPIRSDAFDIAVAVTGGLVVLVVIVGWFGDRQVLRAQERQLLEQGNQLALHRQAVQARDKQHLLELSLKDKQLEKEVAIREERGKYHELEQTFGALDSSVSASGAEDTSGAVSASARRGPPPALSRPRRTLADGDESDEA